MAVALMLWLSLTEVMSTVPNLAILSSWLLYLPFLISLCSFMVLLPLKTLFQTNSSRPFIL